MSEINLDEYISSALTDFGKEVNTNRQLVLSMDGLKPVFRRVIYTALGYSDQMIKTATLSGATMGTLHPHSGDSINDVISSLVRFRVFDGQGNHGLKMIYGEDVGPSSSRYTEAKVNPAWRKIFSDLLAYIPMIDGELSGNKEPRYLPTPIPLILLFSGIGIGFGANARYPMFTPQSLLEAFVNDDPNLLEGPEGLEIDKSQSELKELWTKGIGKIHYKFKVEQTWLPSGMGTLISGNPEMFKPKIDIEFSDFLNAGQVYVIDQTSGDMPKVFVGRSSKVRAITDQEIFERCQKICQYSKTFRLTVTDGDCVFLIPLKEWLYETFSNYKRLVEEMKMDRLEKLNFELETYTWLPKVAEHFLNNRSLTSEQLSSELGCKLEVVKSILRKSIGTLANVECGGKIDSIKLEILKYESLSVDRYIIDLINQIGNI